MTVSHKRDEVIKRGRNRKPRPKTFRTEQAAVAYAKSKKIESYILKNLKSQECRDKKIVIIRK